MGAPTPIVADGVVPHRTAGVMIIGLYIAVFIYGITCFQGVQYYRRFRQDHWIHKLGVGAVWVFETLNTCIIAYTILHYTVIHRNPAVFAQPSPWVLPVQATLSAAFSSIIHAFLGWRVWILSHKNRMVIGLITFLSFFQFVFSIATTIIALAFPLMINSIVIVVLAFSLTAAADVCVTVFLCYYLQIRKTGNSRSTSVINNIIVLTIHNGVLSSTLAVIAVASLSLTDVWLTYATCFILGKAYFNTLLSSLNSRSSLRDKLYAPDLTYGIGTETIRRQIDDAGCRGNELFLGTLSLKKGMSQKEISRSTANEA